MTGDEAPRRALIVSLRMAPGLAKEFVTVGEHLRARGWRVTYLVSSSYRGRLPAWFDDADVTYLDLPESRAKAFATSWWRLPALVERSVGDLGFDYVTCYNPHPLNARLMAVVRRASPSSRRSVVLHEPWVPLGERRRYGLAGMLRLIAVDVFSQTLLRECTDVVLPSPEARRLYDMRPLRVQGVAPHLVPLCIPDRLPDGFDPTAPPPCSPYVCFVGTINPARRVDDVLAVAEALRDARSPTRVKILTRTDVTSELPNVDILARTTISDQEISDLIAGGLALFLPHTVAAQSGNVPVAYRVGTPILAFDIPGLRQHVRDRETGVLLRRSRLADDVVDAVRFLSTHDLRPACRQRYVEEFSPQTLVERYAWLTGGDHPATDGSASDG